jgi:hypothetical protein
MTATMNLIRSSSDVVSNKKGRRFNHELTTSNDFYIV